MRAFLVLLAALAVTVGSGVACLAAAEASPVRHASEGVCGVVTEVTGAVVTRENPLHNEIVERFPARVVVGRAPAVHLAAALCALARTRPGLMACPADLGLRYRIIFAARGRSIEPVIVSPAGCARVSGIGAPRTASSPRFWRVFGAALGVARATELTFSGGLV